MSNQLRMEKQQAIVSLIESGWSDRRISRELNVHRKTVRGYRQRYIRDGGKPSVQVGSKCTGVLTGTGSKCEAFREPILAKLELGLSAERIHRELRQEHGFDGAYDTVQRFIKKLRQSDPKRVWRMEVEPGQEAQVDYGTMRVLDTGSGRLKQVHFLRVTLSYSRKSYTEAVMRQSTESFIRSLENAFRHFGGVPERLCLDNLKAAVKRADWFDAELNPKLVCFARHYGFTLMPTRPYSPEHKGKVESGVKYVKGSALKGKRFNSLAQVNEHLRQWECSVADCRIHGTTRQQVQSQFEQVEKAKLGTLPADLFASFQEGQRQVHRDSYVEVQGAYYQVPAEHIARQVWVRWDAAMVRVLDRNMKLICTHRRLEKGNFSHSLGVGGVPKSVEDSTRYYRKRLAELGDGCARWADALIAAEPPTAIRRMQGVLHLSQRHKIAEVDRACAKACLHGQYHLKDLRNWLDNPHQQETFSFLQQHELIRDMEHYGQMVNSFNDN